ncbi:MAG: GAF domain-containing SpoIIE family protein phosphatase [Thermoanaerobaculia bacterium]
MNLERRQVERLRLVPAMDGRLAEHPVRVVELGILGSRIEHDEPIVGPTNALTLRWQGQEITVPCAVVHSALVGRNGHDGDANGSAVRYRSGVSFLHASDTAPAAFHHMLDTLSQTDEIERLRTLVEASKLINSSLDPEQLFEAILGVARAELGVDRGTLYFVDEARKEIWAKIAGEFSGELRLPIGQGIAGTVAASGEPIVIHDAYDDPRFDRTADQRSGYRTRSMLTVPIRSGDGRIVGVLQLLNKNDGLFGDRDLDFLSSLSDHMAIAIENARMHLEIVEKQRMEGELELGREIQSALFAKPPSDVRGVELAAQTIPCYEVGGDYYDFIELPNGDLGIAIGDVSGKGVAAALVMSSLQSALRVAAPIEPDLGQLMRRLNALLYRMTRGRKYVTFFLGRYTPSTGELRYVNAGHNPPMVVAGGSLTLLHSTGRPIGILPDGDYESGSVTIDPGATLFLYTDGLNEASDGTDDEYGMERLTALFVEVAPQATPSLAELVLAKVEAYENGAHATDDKTLVVLRRTG